MRGYQFLARRYPVDQHSLQLLVRDTVKEVVRTELEFLLQVDRDAFLAEQGGRKNGTYPRTLVTPYGEVELRVPRDRAGTYTPSFLPPYSRRTPDLNDLVLAMYAAGVTDRKISDTLALLLGHRYSHQTISQATELVRERVEAFRCRPLGERYAIVYIDALFLKVFRDGGGIDKEALYTVLGITPEGHRSILGFWLFPSESALVWHDVLKELRLRGMREVLCFVSDDLAGIEEAIKRAYPASDWQQCTVHKVRNAVARVRREDWEAVAQDLKPIYRGETREEAAAAWQAFRKRWAARYPGVVASWEEDLASLLRFYDYPKPLWPYLRSTNLLERFHREIRRGTKVRDHQFPKPESVLKLIYLESERYEGKWERRKLRGFSEAEEPLTEMFEQRYPATQKSTQNT